MELSEKLENSTALNTNSKLERLSDKYCQINSAAVVKALEAKGFEVADYSEANPRKASRLGYQPHLIQFTHPDFNATDDFQPRLIMRNAHDGTSSVVFYFGIYRFACANGLIVGSTIDGERHRHVNLSLKQVVNSALDLIARQFKVLNTIRVMQSTILDKDQSWYFFTQVVTRCFSHEFQLAQRALIMQQLNETVRTEDVGLDLWRVFNRVQEKIINGGITYRNLQLVNRRRTTTRAVKSIDRRIKLNRELWNIALETLYLNEREVA